MLPKELLREVRQIEIKTKRLVNSVYAGGYRSIFKGRGIEFAGIREYYRGDEFRSIDWKVSARTGKLHVREHIEERELQVVVGLDLSASMAFGTGAKEKRETAVEFAAAMGMAAERNNDRVGACLFSDEVEKYIAPAKGKTHILRLIRDLLYYIPNNKGTNIKQAVDFINNNLTRRSIIFLVTDGINVPNIDRELTITASRHDLIMVLVSDTREEVMPNVGLIELEDPETGHELIIDTSDRELMSEFFEEEKAKKALFIRDCQKRGIDVIRLTAGESVVKPVCKLFAEREKRLASGR